MDNTGSANSIGDVRYRYDDDYPLLYGEPAAQPRPPVRPASLPQAEPQPERPGELPCVSRCPSCGECGR